MEPKDNTHIHTSLRRLDIEEAEASGLRPKSNFSANTVCFLLKQH